MDNEYRGLKLSCGGAPTCLQTGEAVLKQYGIDDADKVQSAWNLIYIILALQAIAFAFLWANRPTFMGIKARAPKP